MSDIREIFSSNGIAVTDKQIEELNMFFELLIETNKIHNLTAITDYDEVVVKHFLDCAVVCPYLTDSATICDIGAGAGFPGIVIKILRPDLDILLVDSLNKRVTFLNSVISKLNLSSISAIHSRAEDLDIKKKNKFDYVVARAVAPLVTLVEYCLPFVRVGGKFIAMKAIEGDNELKLAQRAIMTLGGKSSDSVEIELVGTELTRKLLIIDKIAKTMDIYPRGRNLPRLNPLI